MIVDRHLPLAQGTISFHKVNDAVLGTTEENVGGTELSSLQWTILSGNASSLVVRTGFQAMSAVK